jgi:hypothetical protein
MTYSLEWLQSTFIYFNKIDYTVTYLLDVLPTLHPSEPYFDCRSIFYSITSAIIKYLTSYNFALQNTTQKRSIIQALSINK